MYLHEHCEADTLGVFPIPMFPGFKTVGMVAVPLSPTPYIIVGSIIFKVNTWVNWC